MKLSKNPSPKEVGSYFEQYAAKQMRKNGYRILEMNREYLQNGIRYEIDIIAKKGNTVVFTEVKARGEKTHFDPAISVDRKKQENLRKAVPAYLRFLRQKGIDVRRYQYRFDVVSIRFDAAYHVTEYQYLEQYFEVKDDVLFGFTL